MTDSTGKPKCGYLLIISSALGIVAGASIFFVFLLEFRNYNAALWGLVSGIFAALVLHLQILYKRNALFKMYGIKTFDCLHIVGAASSLLCLIAFITYCILAAKYNKGYELYDYGYPPAAVFSLLTIKWTLVLFFKSKKYKKIMFQDTEVKNLFSGNVGNESENASHALSISASGDLEKNDGKYK